MPREYEVRLAETLIREVPEIRRQLERIADALEADDVE